MTGRGVFVLVIINSQFITMWSSVTTISDYPTASAIGQLADCPIDFCPSRKLYNVVRKWGTSSRWSVGQLAAAWWKRVRKHVLKRN